MSRRRQKANHDAKQRQRAQDRERRAERDRPDERGIAADTPKISTGIVSGKIRIGSSSPPRRTATASAAPMRPIKVSAGVPTSSVSATGAGLAVEIEHQPEHRRAITSGNPVVIQCASALAATTSSSGARPSGSGRANRPPDRRRTGDPASAARQQRAEPQDRRADPASSARSGPSANGISATTVRKNSTPISAPPPTRTARRISRTGMERFKRAHGESSPAATPRPSSIPSDPCTAAMISPPPARCSPHDSWRGSGLRRRAPGPRSARPGARPGGRTASSRARESRRRWPAVQVPRRQPG